MKNISCRGAVIAAIVLLVAASAGLYAWKQTTGRSAAYYCHIQDAGHARCTTNPDSPDCYGRYELRTKDYKGGIVTDDGSGISGATCEGFPQTGHVLYNKNGNYIR